MAETERPAVGWPSVVIVGIAVVAVVAVVFKAMDKYEEAKDAVALLSGVIGPLAGIAAAAFGIKQSSDAKAETKQVKSNARSLADRADRLRSGGHEVRGVAGGGDDLLAELQADLRRLAE